MFLGSINGFGRGFNNDNPLSNYGPLNTDYHHVLNISSLVQLPKQFELGTFITYLSRSPFSVCLGGLDFDGDMDDLLPGTKVNEFNRGLGKADLQHLKICASAAAFHSASTYSWG